MKHSSHRRYIWSGGVLLSSLYLFLLGAASFCLFVHAAPPNESTHHSQHAANHSTLCVWACQVGSYSSTDQLVSTTESKPDLLVVATLQYTSSIAPQYGALSIRSRGPPRPSFSL
ncbi:hypothetical protein [Candidatus Nitrospira salsa]